MVHGSTIVTTGNTRIGHQPSDSEYASALCVSRVYNPQACVFLCMYSCTRVESTLSGAVLLKEEMRFLLANKEFQMVHSRFQE